MLSRNFLQGALDGAGDIDPGLLRRRRMAPLLILTMRKDKCGREKTGS
jgi:hypothetical protein